MWYGDMHRTGDGRGVDHSCRIQQVAVVWGRTFRVLVVVVKHDVGLFTVDQHVERCSVLGEDINRKRIADEPFATHDAAG